MTTPGPRLPEPGSAPTLPAAPRTLPVRELAGLAMTVGGGGGALTILGLLAGWLWPLLVVCVLTCGAGWQLSTDEV